MSVASCISSRCGIKSDENNADTITIVKKRITFPFQAVYDGKCLAQEQTYHNERRLSLEAATLVTSRQPFGYHVSVPHGQHAQT